MAAQFLLPRRSNKTLKLFASLFFLVGFVFGIFTLEPISKNTNDPAVKGVQTAATPTIAVTIQNSSDSAKEEATVLKVADGDTLTVLLNGQKEKIRIIGINTPETVDPRRPVQCFGKEASNKAKELLTDQTVFLESDPTQDSRDKYGRLLRFVWLANGEDYGRYMIENGYANEYTYETSYKYQSLYQQKQEEAAINKRGLWSDVCK